MSSQELLRIESQLARLRQLQERAARSGSKASDRPTGGSSSKDPDVPQASNKGGQSAKESSDGWRSKVCTGLRVDRRVLPLFKNLCHGEGSTLGRAVEEFMQASIEAGSVQVALAGARRLTEAQRRTDVSFVRLKMADVESMMESGRVDMGRGSLFHLVRNEDALLASANSILSVLPRINDSELSGKTTMLLERVMAYVKEERLHNIRQTPVTWP